MIPSETVRLVFHTLYALVLDVAGDTLCAWSHDDVTVEHALEEMGLQNATGHYVRVWTDLGRRFPGRVVVLATAKGRAVPVARVRLCLARQGRGWGGQEGSDWCEGSHGAG